MYHTLTWKINKINLPIPSTHRHFSIFISSIYNLHVCTCMYTLHSREYFYHQSACIAVHYDFHQTQEWVFSIEAYPGTFCTFCHTALRRSTHTTQKITRPPTRCTSSTPWATLNCQSSSYRLPPQYKLPRTPWFSVATSTLHHRALSRPGKIIIHTGKSVRVSLFKSKFKSNFKSKFKSKFKSWRVEE